MSFCDDSFRRTEPIYRAILEHPFNAELAEGRLSDERFRHYILQDALYLIAYSRALSIVAARAPEAPDMVKFAGAAQEAVVVERALHESYFGQFGLSEAEIAAAEPSPTCLAYTSFLVATAYHAPYEVAVAAVLPCFRIYWDVGRHVHERAAPDNPFRAWIDTYADEEYGGRVRDAMAIADRVAGGVGDAVKAQMHGAYRRSSQLEWMFWDAAYRLEGWPIG